MHWIRGDALIPYPEREKLKEKVTYDYVAGSDWSVEDTRTLLDACERYELRWPIIVDRLRSSSTLPSSRLVRSHMLSSLIMVYSMMSSSLRSRPLEELQARYLANKSANAANAITDAEDQTEEYDTEAFIKKERSRRLYLEWLFRRHVFTIIFLYSVLFVVLLFKGRKKKKLKKAN